MNQISVVFSQGILAAQFALQRAQTALTQIGQESNVNLCFFHGRGGGGC